MGETANKMQYDYSVLLISYNLAEDKQTALIFWEEFEPIFLSNVNFKGRGTQTFLSQTKGWS